MKIIYPSFILIIFLFTSSCGGFKEAGKVLRNEKTTSTDEFLVKKRDPLVLPPDYDKIPEPNSQNSDVKEENKNKVKKILQKSVEEKPSNNKTSSTEDSILNKIKK
ncbi:MAG: DUF3035 domain-containing protein [Candidatus Pelagibacter bacterium]|nr:DUF3035 domain-containing protein [Candidatus Pelagibacter bacterium]